MFHGHVLEFEKTKMVLEGFTISHGTAHLQKVKHNIKLNPFFSTICYLLPKPTNERHYYENWQHIMPHFSNA
jgi:hypothetical protein